MKKKSKAAAIIDLLKKGFGPAEIKRRMKVSESYIYMVKSKLVAAPEEAEVETIQLSYNPEAGEYIVVEGAKSAQEVDAILNQRASTYGNFFDHATVAYQLKNVAHQFTAEKGKSFEYDQCEALDMIFSKIGRILNGDPNHLDSWVDIAGYAQLVADRLQGKVR